MKPYVTAVRGTFERDPDQDHFYGEVLRELLSDAPKSPDLRCSFVKFERGAFTKLHHHVSGQVLWVTDGRGFIQFADGHRFDLCPGTRVVIPPGEIHRHGADLNEHLEHLAITWGETFWWTAPDSAGHPEDEQISVSHYPMTISPQKQQPEDLRTVYQQLCESYRAIDDFRMKLMGLLPLVTGGGIFLLIADEAKLTFAHQFFLPIGAFGFLVTLGLFCYELYGIKRCHGIIDLGTDLEAAMKIGNGQFTKHPSGVAGFINEPFASGIIYPAVLAAWFFVASIGPPQTAGEQWATGAAQHSAIRVFITGFVIALLLNLWLKRKNIKGVISGLIHELRPSQHS